MNNFQSSRGEIQEGERVFRAEVVVQVKMECKVFEKTLDKAGRTFSVFGCEALLQTPSLVPPAGAQYYK